MKTRIRQIAKKSISRFKILFLTGFIFTAYARGTAQSTQVYKSEIEVKEGVNIESNLPTSIEIRINGTVTTNNTKDSYNIEGKNGDVRLNILKDLEIETWNKNIVKQKTEVIVKAASKDIEVNFLKALNLSLKEKAGKKVIIDTNLDIESFEMENGFFKADDCEIKLKNGKKFKIEYLELSSYLTVPEKSNLSIKGSNYGTIRLGELNGDLDLELKYTEVYGLGVKRLKGSLQWCYNVIFEKVAMADLSSTNSYVKIKNLGGANIGSLALNDAGDLLTMKYKSSNSAQTTYEFGTVGLLQVSNSNNDEFIADEAGMIEVKKTKYSDFNIKRLNASLLVDAKNTNIDIDEIGKQFLSIDIKNTLSTIDLGFEEGTNYIMQIERNKYFEFDADQSVLRLKENKEEGIDYYQKGNKENAGQIHIDCDKCKLDFN